MLSSDKKDCLPQSMGECWVDGDPTPAFYLSSCPHSSSYLIPSPQSTSVLSIPASTTHSSHPQPSWGVWGLSTKTGHRFSVEMDLWTRALLRPMAHLSQVLTSLHPSKSQKLVCFSPFNGT